MEAIRNNDQRLREISDAKYDDIMYTLELFEGKVSLAEIMSAEIPFINGLKESKIRYNERLREYQESQIQKDKDNR